MEEVGMEDWRGQAPVERGAVAKLEVAVERHKKMPLEWVRGHNEHALNERVDRIANREAQSV